ncbi:MAG: radical SAM protein, partial [Clostridia bacterium]|nr:radical SAM protein [Clostridia bacterium]
MSAQIISVDKGSYGEKAGILAGDVLLSVNSHRIEDVFDYQFYTYDDNLDITVQRNGAELHFNIKKSEGEYIGLNFDTYLMDEQKSCYNKCIFCFIDQNPKGMRETIYFKDDDARLSFLVGNYISLTNISDKDAERIVKMHFSPLNISVHTTDPELRKLMLGNRFAGDALRHLKTFADAGLEIKTQIVVCPGVNDGENLKKTLRDLSDLYPSVVSIACVPVGLSKHREGLYP